MKNRITALLLITAMCFGGCNVIQKDKVAKISVEELANMGYVIYEEEEIIDGIREIYNGIIVDALTSFATTMEMIKENMPIENIREYSDGYIIEYPMENRMFVIVTDKNGIGRASFMRAYEERTEKNIKKLKDEMREEDVKKLFPEIEVSDWSESEVFLDNNEIVRLVFKEKEDDKVLEHIEYITYPFGESEFEEIMNIKEGELIPPNTLLVIDNVLIKGESQLEEFIDGRENDVLKIRYIDGMEEIKPYESTLQYQNGNYILEDSQYGTRQNFKYIIKLKGESLITGNKEEGYFLTNDKEVTYEEVTHEILKSSSVESMDYRQLFLAN